MLYLLKGSRIREHHQQNLWILAAPERATAPEDHWVQPLSLLPNDVLGDKESLRFLEGARRPRDDRARRYGRFPPF